MGDGRVIATVRIVTEQPLPYLPRLEHYLRTVAEDEDYFSEGRLRPSEAHAIFHYTLRGRGECTVGARTYPVTAGQGFLQVVNDPACGYRYPHGGTEDWAFCCFCFSGGNTLPLVSDMIKTYGPVFSPDGRSPVLRRLADEERWLACPTIGRMESAELFYSLIFMLASLGERARDRAADEQLRLCRTLVEQAMHLIEERLADDPSVEELAAGLGVTREHLSRRFHQYTGRSLKRYLSEQRALLACRLLKETDLSVQEIAARLSFSSPTNFIRFFKDILQVTPAVFRESGQIPFY